MMIVYGVHAVAFGHVGPTELVSVHLAVAEESAQNRSIQVHGEVFLTSRQLEQGGPWQVLQVWKDGLLASRDAMRCSISTASQRSSRAPGAPGPPTVLDPPNGVRGPDPNP